MSSESQTNRQLIAQAVAGETSALGDLLRQCAPDLARQLHIKNTYLSKMDVDDVLQVTFLEAFLSIRDFDPSRADTFSNWLLRIAENNLLDMVRALRRDKRPPPERQVSLTGDESYVALFERLTADSSTASRRLASAEAQQLVGQAVEKLPIDYRKVVELCDLEDRSLEQVSEMLNRSRGAVYMLRARAHDRLRLLLGRESRFFG